VTVQSVNGPEVTVICGYQMPGATNGPAAVRCAFLTSGAALAGFTLTNGATLGYGSTAYGQSGGGVWCESVSVVVSNCLLLGNFAYGYGGGVNGGTLYECMLTGNSASSGGGACGSTLYECMLTGNSASSGGGACWGTLHNCMVAGNSASVSGGGAYAYGGTLDNCTLTGNSAFWGGGAAGGTLNNCALTRNSAGYCGGAGGGMLNNCTLTGNSAYLSGGGSYNCTLNNCIVYYNTAPDGNYDSSSTLNYCCTRPLPADGTGNLTVEPQLASAWCLSASSPCRGAGSTNYTTGLDIDGEAWANPPSVGCDEYWSGAVTGALSAGIAVSYARVAAGFGVNFQALIGGRVTGSRWDFGDGVVVSNRPWASHGWLAEGDYVVELRAYNETYPGGVASSVTMHVGPPVHYVAFSNAAPAWPHATWATAATNMQDAVDAAAVGALVLVSNGVYQTGARSVYGMSNRVAVAAPMTIRSVNGPDVTVIRGYQVPGTTNGPEAVRCVYLTNGAVLAGFTLTSGATQTSGDNIRQTTGGGVWCESGVVSNCVLTGNSASVYGGGACGGTLHDCRLTGNSAAMGGGTYYGTLNNCTLSSNSADYGGGAFNGTLNSCTLSGNSAYSYGGGAYGGTLNNCMLTGNSAASGGGVNSGTLDNCTVTGNSAALSGGGAYGGALRNCIVYYNTAPDGNYDSSSTVNYCCTTPLAVGLSNFTTVPLFVDTNGWSNLRLQASSPCINSGNSAYVVGTTDIDGRPRIVGGTVDIGAHEFQGPGMGEFMGWLQQYGLPTDGSADYADTDHDGMNNWQEWTAGTNPTNAASVLRLQAPVINPPGLLLCWSSVTNHAYFVERATNLANQAVFMLLQAQIPGLPLSTSFTDTNPPPSGRAFYRVGVQP
jgi:hypothetical protein